MPTVPIPSYPLPTATELPAGRVDWSADPARSVLLVHDMQRYFVRAFDARAEPIAEATRRIGSIREIARRSEIPVLYSVQPGGQDPAERALLWDFWGPGPTADPNDTAIIDELEPAADEVVFTKWRYSAFQRTDLRERLQALGRDQLLITGIYTHIGILATALEAFMRDVQAFVVADATADLSRGEHLSALEWMAGRCARVVSAAGLASQLGAQGATQATSSRS